MLNFTIKMRRIENPTTSLLAFCDVIIDDILVVTGFKVLEYQGDIYAKSPSQLSNKVDEKGNRIWYPTVYFNDAKENETDKRTPCEHEILTAIVKEYLATTKTSNIKPESIQQRPVAAQAARGKSNPWQN